MSLRADLRDKQFGRLTVIEFFDKNKHGQVLWKSLCICGNYAINSANQLTQNRVKSCGCLSYELSLESKTRHGMSNSKTFRCWSAMLARCRDLNDPLYGGRGIKVCERWLTFENFFADMGFRPKGMTLDRYPDFNGNYEPNNCRWATPKQQARNRNTNRNIVFEGEEKTLSELAEKFGLNYFALRSRLDRGLSVEQALSIPVRKVGKIIQIPVRGRLMTLTSAAKITGISRTALRKRIKAGWPIERILTEPVKTIGNTL